MFLGKQRLPFRGDNDDLCTTKNPGHFLALLSVLLRVILFFLITSINPGPRLPLVFPPRSHNDIISVVGHDIILANRVAEIKQSNFFSVLADEVAATILSNYQSAFNLWTVKATFMEAFIAFLKLN